VDLLLQLIAIGETWPPGCPRAQGLTILLHDAQGGRSGPCFRSAGPCRREGC
jgi:hypothetical protein